MELLLDDYDYSIRFSLIPYSINESKTKWKELKNKCENGNNESIANEWVSLCNSELKDSFTFINSLEGGIRHNTNKTCHFRYSFSDEYDDNYIVMRYFNNSESGKWKYEELDNLINAFEKMANGVVGGVYVSGSIVMSKKENYDYDTESDNDY